MNIYQQKKIINLELVVKIIFLKFVITFINNTMKNKTAWIFSADNSTPPIFKLVKLVRSTNGFTRKINEIIFFIFPFNIKNPIIVVLDNAIIDWMTVRWIIGESNKQKKK